MRTIKVFMEAEVAESAVGSIEKHLSDKFFRAFQETMQAHYCDRFNMRVDGLDGPMTLSYENTTPQAKSSTEASDSARGEREGG